MQLRDRSLFVEWDMRSYDLKIHVKQFDTFSEVNIGFLDCIWMLDIDQGYFKIASVL